MLCRQTLIEAIIAFSVKMSPVRFVRDQCWSQFCYFVRISSRNAYHSFLCTVSLSLLDLSLVKLLSCSDQKHLTLTIYNEHMKLKYRTFYPTKTLCVPCFLVSRCRIFRLSVMLDMCNLLKCFGLLYSLHSHNQISYCCPIHRIRTWTGVRVCYFLISSWLKFTQT